MAERRRRCVQRDGGGSPLPRRRAGSTDDHQSRRLAGAFALRSTDVQQSHGTGLFIWKNCAAGTWQARMTAGGGSSIVYRGNAQSSQNFTSVTGYSIETNDTLNVSDPSNVVYALSVSGSGEDGFDFAFPASATVCFNATAPAGVPIYLGADRTPMLGPFNLGTLGACN
jgi:hypothetical protein